MDRRGNGDKRYRTVLGLAAGAVALCLAGVPLYVFPASGRVGPADIAYVIGPPTRERIVLAEDLLSSGVVDRVIVSVPATGGQSAGQLSVCRVPDVTCAVPDPSTTKGEVAMLQQLVGPGESVIVITFAPHVARTRFIFDRCYDGTVTVIASPTSLSAATWAYQYAYQSTSFVKAAITPCQ